MDSTPTPSPLEPAKTVDLLCIGIAVYDLVFTVDHHPQPDEKMTANTFFGCGGGLAANAAVAAARLGHHVALATYLGNDVYGEQHLAELVDAGVDVRPVVRGEHATSLSTILVKPDGARTIVNYRKEMPSLPPADLDLSEWSPKAILVDGNHLALAQAALAWAKERNIPTVIDADRVLPGPVALASQVDYLVASERFAREYTGNSDPTQAAHALLALAPHVVITLGERGLVWRNRNNDGGDFAAFAVTAVDTTGAGDAFHGAFAAGLAAGYDWPYLLAYASATGALCTTVAGARPGMPTRQQVETLLATTKSVRWDKATE